MFYSGLAGGWITGLVRGCEGTTAADYYGWEPVCPVSVELAGGVWADYPDRGWVAVGLGGLEYWKPSERRGDFLLVCGNAASINAGSNYVLEKTPEYQAVIDGWSARVSARSRRSGCDHLRRRRGRAAGTASEAHAAGAVAADFLVKYAHTGAGDPVTILDRGADKAARTVTHYAALQGRHRIALGDFVPRTYAAVEAGRLLKWPSGELPWRVPGSFSVGSLAEWGGRGWKLDGMVDEIRTGEDTDIACRTTAA